MSKKEPTNADIMAELKRQNVKLDRVSALLEGIISHSERLENPGPYGNVKGLDSALVAEAMGRRMD